MRRLRAEQRFERWTVCRDLVVTQPNLVSDVYRAFCEAKYHVLEECEDSFAPE